MDNRKQREAANDLAPEEREPQRHFESTVPERSSGMTDRGETADVASATAVVPDPSGEQMPD